MMWLANLSARRLLNRVHHVVYDGAATGHEDKSPHAATPSLGSITGEAPSNCVSRLPLTGVTEELGRQMHAWYGVLPANIRPSLDEPTPSVHEALLLLRYNATGHILYRPYFFHVCGLETSDVVSEEMMDNAVKCVHHCREFIRLSPHRLGTSCGSLESIMHG